MCVRERVCNKNGSLFSISISHNVSEKGSCPIQFHICVCVCVSVCINYLEKLEVALVNLNLVCYKTKRVVLPLSFLLKTFRSI